MWEMLLFLSDMIRKEKGVLWRFCWRVNLAGFRHFVRRVGLKILRGWPDNDVVFTEQSQLLVAAPFFFFFREMSTMRLSLFSFFVWAKVSAMDCMSALSEQARGQILRLCFGTVLAAWQLSSLSFEISLLCLSRVARGVQLVVRSPGRRRF